MGTFSSPLQRYMWKTGASYNSIIHANYIVDISPVENKAELFVFDFLKCRCKKTILDWFEQTWGPEGAESGWWENPFTMSFRLIVCGESRVLMWRMVWE